MSAPTPKHQCACGKEFRTAFALKGHGRYCAVAKTLAELPETLGVDTPLPPGPPCPGCGQDPDIPKAHRRSCAVCNPAPPLATAPAPASETLPSESNDLPPASLDTERATMVTQDQTTTRTGVEAVMTEAAPPRSQAPEGAVARSNEQELARLVEESVARRQEERQAAEAYFLRTGQLPPGTTTAYAADDSLPRYSDGTRIEIPGHVLRWQPADDADTLARFRHWGAEDVTDPKTGAPVTGFFGRLLKIPVPREAERQAEALAPVKQTREEQRSRIERINEDNRRDGLPISVFQPTPADMERVKSQIPQDEVGLF